MPTPGEHNLPGSYGDKPVLICVVLVYVGQLPIKLLEVKTGAIGVGTRTARHNTLKAEGFV